MNDAASSLKWTVTVFLLLSGIGFSVAALMSRERYGFDHARTLVHYLGDETEGGMRLAMPYGQVIQTAHVHSFSMPLVFLALWLGLHFVPLRPFLKKLLIGGGALSILLYNAAPFLVRYKSPHYVTLFTVGGIGLFFFFFLPAFLILYETWWGFSSEIKRKNLVTSRS
ncbi:MAG TPA: hypothetical protein DF383_11660 [Deltaproteobacteria bacterium]|nr:hypothetical protein [Deltaproteobacteria bacterium]